MIYGVFLLEIKIHPDENGTSYDSRFLFNLFKWRQIPLDQQNEYIFNVQTTQKIQVMLEHKQMCKDILLGRVVSIDIFTLY